MAVKFRDYYETLDVKRDATHDEIRSAFRKLARKYHPDVAADKTAAEERFKEINEAYEVLGDPEKRRKYDELGPNWQQGQEFRPPPGWGQAGGGWAGAGMPETEVHFGGTGFSDFFETFFGTRRGFGDFAEFAGPGRGRRGADFARRGRDIEADLMVTLEEAFHGSTRTITFQRTKREGGVGTPETYTVKIPPGVREGQRIRLAGQGEGGVGGGGAGDLLLRVRFARHPDFRVEGSDLNYELTLAPWEAVLGCTAGVPTLSGEVSLKVPPGTQAGGKLRLRGMGLPEKSGGRGDLFAVVTVATPRNVGPRERELWEELARVSKFDPRE